MARKSRRNQIAAVNTAEETIHRSPKRIYSVGIYARKSFADEDNSDSINTQIGMLEKFTAENADLRLYDVYTDDGETGTKFDRPGFNRLMEDIRSGSVDCVVVKDLSRFGRNYMEAGTLLETIFPYMGVRFIAVNERYDSLSETAQENNLAISVENLLNDLYAKDISKKINSVYAENFKKGNYMGAYAPYGYLRSSEDCHKFMIDTETAPTVKKIFEMKAAGETYQGIANYLNSAGIESPSNYKYRIGILKDKRFADEKPWLACVIKRMLRNQSYIGNVVQGRQQCRNSTNKKSVVMPESKWYVSENMHEPIISMDLWENVQSAIKEPAELYRGRIGKYKDRFQPENFLFKKIICSECGKFLRRGHQCPKDYIIYSYYCATVHKDGSRCKCRYHNEERLFQVIFEAVRQQIKLALDTKKVLADLEKLPTFNAEADVITPILKDIRYTGVFIFGKKRNYNFKEMRMPESDWIISKSKFEPIISRELFDEVNTMLYKRNTQENRKPKQTTVFGDKLQCGCCGRRLYKRGSGYRCKTWESKNDSKCPHTTYQEAKIEVVVLDALNNFINLMDITMSKSKEVQKSNASNVNLERMMDKCKKDILSVYESYTAVEISFDNYTDRRQKIEQKIKNIESQRNDIANQQKINNENDKISELLCKSMKDNVVERLTPELVEALVEKIIIYEEDKFEIFWNFTDLMQPVIS